jgi:Prolyl oligopeptidase family
MKPHPPVLLWIHGGPLASWNSWSWRWNPWLAVAQGYAVLLPDPRTLHRLRAGFHPPRLGRWGEAPYTDTMAVTDAPVARPDIDASRTAAMGGSLLGIYGELGGRAHRPFPRNRHPRQPLGPRPVRSHNRRLLLDC